MPRFLNKLVPLLVFITAIAIFLVGIFLLSYLFVFFVAVWLIFYVYNLIRTRLGYPPRGQNSQQRMYRGQSQQHRHAGHTHRPGHVDAESSASDANGTNSDGKPGRVIDTEWKKL